MIRNPLVHCPKLYDLTGIAPGGVVTNLALPQTHDWRQRFDRSVIPEEDGLRDAGFYCTRCLSRVTAGEQLEYSDPDFDPEGEARQARTPKLAVPR